MSLKCGSLLNPQSGQTGLPLWSSESATRQVRSKSRVPIKLVSYWAVSDCDLYGEASKLSPSALFKPLPCACIFLFHLAPRFTHALLPSTKRFPECPSVDKDWNAPWSTTKPLLKTGFYHAECYAVARNNSLYCKCIVHTWLNSVRPIRTSLDSASS